MSRIGKLPISIPSGVTLTMKDNVLVAKGAKGELEQKIDGSIALDIQESEVVLFRDNDSKQSKALHGLYRSLVSNMVEGVSVGYKKELELVGVGYRANVKGQDLELSLGFSHNVLIHLAPEIKATAVSERGKNPLVTLESHDKQLIGQVAAKIRSLRMPEPYKGKGGKFVGEEIRRKAGKSASK